MSGLFGVASRSNCMDLLFYGTDYHSHLGTEFAGLAIRGNQLHRAIHRIANGQFKNLFDGFYHGHRGEMGIGVISDSNPQPITIESKFGTCTFATAGLITNRRELAQELIDAGMTFSETTDGQMNPTELVANLMAQSPDIVSGIQDVFARIEGSVSLLVMTNDGVYAACDDHARLPLVIGEKEGVTAVASESCAFPNLGLTVRKWLQPGEIIHMDAGGLKAVRGGNGARRICSFLWIYTGYPASSYEGISVECVRERCGQALARKDDVQADLASGVPDSGTGHAIGYAMQSRLPFRRPLVKYSAGYGRSYTPPSQDVRDRVAKMKLIPIEDVARGQRIVLCEDSIVRGTQLRNLTIQKLWEAGAAEVHVRVACPPLMFPCIYNLSTRSREELAGRRAIHAIEGKDAEDVGAYTDESTDKYKAMADWIRRDITATSLIYLNLDEMVKAIGLPRCDLCTYCWSGHTA